MAGPIRIAVLANASQAKRELNSTATTFGKIGAGFKKMAAPAIGVLGAIALGAKKTVDGAAIMQGAISRTNVIFGKNAGNIKAWSKSAATDMGLSKSMALQTAAGFGNMFSQIGFSAGETSKMSKGVTQMSADLGAFNDLETADVANRMSAAFRGEFDSLQAVIPNINAARVQTEALAATGKKSASALTAQEKATAVLAIVERDGAKAKGAFAKEAASASGQAKIQAAKMADLSDKIGAQLLPAYVKIQGAILKVTGALSGHTGTVLIVVGVIAALAAGVLLVNGVMAVAGAVTTVYTGVMAAHAAIQKAATAASLGTRLGLIALAIQTTITAGVTKAAAAAQWLMNAAMMANPIGLVIIAIVALVAIFVIAWKKSETFRKIVIGAWNAIKAATVAVWNFVKRIVMTVVNAVKTVITTYFKAYAAVIKAAWNVIKSATVAVWNGIKTAVRVAVGVVTDIVRGIKGKITGIFSGAAGWLKGAGKAILNGLIDGIRWGIDKVKGMLQSVTNLIPDWKGPAAKDAKLLKPAGKLIIGGFVDSLESQRPKVRKYFRALTDEISTFSASPKATVKLSAEDAYMNAAGAGRPIEHHHHYNVRADGTTDLVALGKSLKKAIKEAEGAGAR